MSTLKQENNKYNVWTLDFWQEDNKYNVPLSPVWFCPLHEQYVAVTALQYKVHPAKQSAHRAHSTMEDLTRALQQPIH